MTFNLLSLILISLLSTLFLFSSPQISFLQEKNTESNLWLDPEDAPFLTDLYLDDYSFSKKYIQKFSNSNPKFLLQSYKSTQDPKTRIFVLKLASTLNQFNDPFVVELFDIALTSGIKYDFDFFNPNSISNQWKVRAAAAYIIHQNPDNIQPQSKLTWTKSLVFLMRQEPEERVKGIAALALAKLFQNDPSNYHLQQSTQQQQNGQPSSIQNQNQSSRYDLLKKDVVVKILNYYLQKISTNDQFLCWSLVKALGYLKSQNSFFLLLSTRQKGFHQKIKLEISRSLNAIISQKPSS